MKLLIGIGIIVVIVSITFFHKKTLTNDEMMDKAIFYTEQNLKKDVKMPESLQTRNVSFGGHRTDIDGLTGAVCGEFAAKNGDGKMTAYSYFVQSIEVDKKGELVSMGRVLYPVQNEAVFEALCSKTKKAH
ncbi:hypothetical protein [Kosakonia sp. R1.Fl]|uniref:hypothetical protein n=1 Tax=Kosakonia sp. R1.Fl TaxID=2928706 RepID=UPI00201DDBB4|nr:hypothetical protein [Kosakonia sp. R1.Fl]MCL6747010.1 hypothetical protein [Kosakonia sp. R1.Fl]